MDFHLHHQGIFKFSVSIFILILSSTNSRNNSSFIHYVESSSLTVDREALLSFKSPIIDPSNALSSWNTSLNNVCDWTGVICDQVIVDDGANNSTSNKNQTRVTGLDLERFGLSGTLSLGNLSFLRVLHLPNNKFSGTLILPNYAGELCQLRTLNISSNDIHGQIPLSIVKCSELRILDLMGNQLSGNIPPEIGQYLLRLQVLKLNQNQLSGTIPPSIGNISSLTVLDLGTNTIGGPIPSELGRLQKLKTLSLSINNLTGTVPPSLYNITSLVHFALPSNNLWGEIPSDVGDKLPNLIDFNFCINKFTGKIPGSLHYLPNIQNIRMAHNLLEGTVPPGLENLRSLRMYNIGYNRIVGSLDFISSFSTSPNLDFLALDGNLFQGAIPESIGFDLSETKLTKLYMGENRISGKIPASVNLLTNLALLNLSYNSISGEIPPEIGNLKNLQELVLAENKISGGIPPSLGDLNKLNVLDLHGNELVGAIPNSLGSLQRLNSLDLSRNELNGSIPGQVLSGLSGLSSLLNMSRNSLSGSLPQEIRNLKNLVTIDVSHNKLSGSIPNSIEECRSLQKLFMSSNSFSGHIPSTLANVLGMEILDLSSNQLSGPIPNNLEKLQALHLLNLSYNDLEGQLPSTGVFKNFTSVYVQGNFKLCSNSSHFSPSLPVCRQRRKKSVATRVVVLLIIASASVFSLLLVASFVYYMLIYRKNVASGEYGQGRKPSTRGDVYSFGIMLLEMFTGRSPTHEGFNGGISLVKWVESGYPNDILQVLDPQLQMLHQTSEPSLPIIMNGITGSSCSFEDKQIEHGFFISTVGVGLSCAVDAPEMRITIREALQRLKEIRDTLVYTLSGFFSSPLPRVVGIHVLESPVIHPVRPFDMFQMEEGLFNFVIGWTLMFAPLLFTDRKRNRFKGSLDVLWGFQMFLTNTFLIPYMAIRLNKADTESSPKEPSKLEAVMVDGASVVGLISGAVCTLCLAWACFGRMDGNFGTLTDRWEYFLSYLGSDRLGYAFIWDICLYTVFQPWLIGDNIDNVKDSSVNTVEKLRFVPVVGLVAYLLSLDPAEEL
ncbi:hypothetical protein C5167_017464 [Papaver somniferum]|uniref:non-specific serine/threonine protein kinase n=1 Tax=Papaver somniferum TaxID=3469 RepID=A0A4Y7IJH2_PAPSO|nr:hypothetical protein C5167_017464 [Papaver somniferum]